MKFLLVALSALALASAQTTTTTVNVGLSLVGNADGSATITVGSAPAVTLPAAVVTAAKDIIGAINTIASSVTAGTNLSTNLAVTVDSATGTITLAAGGQTLTLTRAAIRTVVGLAMEVKKAIVDALPRNRKGGKRGRSRKHSHERRH